MTSGLIPKNFRTPVGSLHATRIISAIDDAYDSANSSYDDNASAPQLGVSTVQEALDALKRFARPNTVQAVTTYTLTEADLFTTIFFTDVAGCSVTVPAGLFVALENSWVNLSRAVGGGPVLVVADVGVTPDIPSGLLARTRVASSTITVFGTNTSDHYSVTGDVGLS